MGVNKKCLKKAIYVFLIVFLSAPVLNIPYRIFVSWLLGQETNFSAAFAVVWPVVAAIAAAAACIVYVIAESKEEKKDNEAH